MEKLSALAQIMAWSGLTLFILGIALTYKLINKRTYSNPIFLLIAGFLFLAFSLFVKAYYSVQFSDNIYPYWNYISSIIEVSCAALGGSLFSSSFMIKMQREHNEAKIYVKSDMVNEIELIDEVEEQKSFLRENKSDYTNSEYTDKMQNLRERKRESKKKLAKLRMKLDKLELL